jgi:hypothetical protein
MDHPPFNRLPNPTVWRLRLAARDFENGAKFVEGAGRHDIASLEHEALLECAVIRYARPFSGNERDPTPIADSKLTADIVDPAQVLGTDRELHERIVRLRNTLVAHSEAAQNPVALLAPTDGLESDLHAAGFVSRRWHIVNEQLDLAAFARIAKTMMVKCMNMLADFTRTGRL